MPLDYNGLLSDDQAITADAISTNVIDTWEGRGAAADTIPWQTNAITPRWGLGTCIPIFIGVTTTFATLTSLTVTVESDSTADLATSATVHWTSAAIPVASLVAGYRFQIRQLPIDFTPERYVGIRYNVTGSNATAGTILAQIGSELSSFAVP